MILAHGTGATDYDLEDEGDVDGSLLVTVRKLVEARGASEALALLDAAPFGVFSARNHFNDEFDVLYAELPIGEYEQVRLRQVALRGPAQEILQVFAEMGQNVRLVVVEPTRHTAPWSPPDYQCEADPFAEGGYARIYRARPQTSGNIVALKRLHSGDTEDARARLRREIQEQGRLHHINVMPILDQDPAFEWFTMPLAEGNLSDLRVGLGTDEMIEMIASVARGLAAAHALGLVHRDVTPRNILRVVSPEGARWVVADWGLVRRPRGLTSTMRTEPGQPFGTEGFVAPEVANDGHEADERSDVYSLGRVLGFALLGQVPRPNLPQNVQGPWRQFVQRTTHPDPSRRPATMTDVLALLSAAQSGASPPPSPAERALVLTQGLTAGDAAAVDEFVELALANLDDIDLWLDYVGDMPRAAIEQMVAARRVEAAALLEPLLDHLSRNWGGRSYDASNAPLQRFLWIAYAAEAQQAWGLLEDAARALFEGEVKCERFKQRQATRRWLLGLRGEAAATVARALSAVPAAIKWYLKEDWRPNGADASLRAVLR